MAPRALTRADLDWVVELAARAAERRQSYAPRFWRRAPGARRIHARYLAGLIDEPGVRALRTEHAFAIGQRGVVDDAAAEHPAHWATEGPALLRQVAGERPVRFVCPVPEPEKAALAVALGLRRTETWWHRDLTAEPSSEGPLVGRLVEAPPVYAPGGPVLLVTEPLGREELAEAERRAAARGAVVSVVTRPADDPRYRRTCDFYAGTVSAR